MKTPSVVLGMILLVVGALVAAAGGIGIQLYRKATPSSRTGLPSTPKKGEKNYEIAILVIGLLVGLAGIFIVIMHFKKNSSAAGTTPPIYTSLTSNKPISLTSNKPIVAAGNAPPTSASYVAPIAAAAQAQDFSLGEVPSPQIPQAVAPPPLR